MFKTLVTSVDGALVVGVVPVATHLYLKALAAATGGKKASMAKVADAERSSGYVAGGISPLGQRKALPTVIDSTAGRFQTIMVSAGRRGLQVELAPADLIAACRAKVADIASDLPTRAGWLACPAGRVSGDVRAVEGRTADERDVRPDLFGLLRPRSARRSNGPGPGPGAP